MLSCDVAVQTSFFGAHTLSLDASAQTTSPSTLSRHVSTQMGSRPASSFSVDASVQTPIRCVVQYDAATQLPLTEFFIGCIYSNSPLDRQNSVTATNAGFTCFTSATAWTRTTHVGTHPVRTASSAKRSASTAVTTLLAPIFVQMQASSDSSCGQFWATQVQRTRPHCHSRQ